MQLVMSYKFIRHIKKLYSILMLVKFQVEKIIQNENKITMQKNTFKLEKIFRN